MLVELVEARGETAGSLQRVAHGVNGAMRSVRLPRDRRPTRSLSFFSGLPAGWVPALPVER